MAIWIQIWILGAFLSFFFLFFISRNIPGTNIAHVCQQQFYTFLKLRDQKKK